MSNLRRSWWLASALTTAALVVGCAEESTTSPPSAPSPSPSAAPALKPDDAKPAPADDKKGDMPKTDAPKTDAPKLEGPKADTPKSAAAAKLTDEELAEVKKLPADDATAALAQVLCPLSGEHLGSMGKPIKLTAEGKSLYVCCANCEPDFKKDPKAAFAKLNAK